MFTLIWTNGSTSVIKHTDELYEIYNDFEIDRAPEEGYPEVDMHEDDDTIGFIRDSHIEVFDWMLEHHPNETFTFKQFETLIEENRDDIQ